MPIKSEVGMDWARRQLSFAVSHGHFVEQVLLKEPAKLERDLTTPWQEKKEARRQKGSGVQHSIGQRDGGPNQAEQAEYLVTGERGSSTDSAMFFASPLFLNSFARESCCRRLIFAWRNPRKQEYIPKHFRRFYLLIFFFKNTTIIF